ncbi:hypothetical protein FVEG_15095 [Fusarium verticillioides 7600]|uniref:Uncharacterized protein n=1 Tax=Gibberella moniliformis (strain M3125 / FGSC 7600) TaxID=334819 RepID=W7LKN6_GIBM7|nr:hypothetical protein FVEG_15095 [Fusarium verticillioides 7600]EWG39948.1 hypothetical protein FVEG_15095 [Fusarium verticillioides 7600]
MSSKSFKSAVAHKVHEKTRVSLTRVRGGTRRVKLNWLLRQANANARSRADSTSSDCLECRLPCTLTALSQAAPKKQKPMHHLHVSFSPITPVYCWDSRAFRQDNVCFFIPFLRHAAFAD